MPEGWAAAYDEETGAYLLYPEDGSMTLYFTPYHAEKEGRLAPREIMEAACLQSIPAGARPLDTTAFRLDGLSVKGFAVTEEKGGKRTFVRLVGYYGPGELLSVGVYGRTEEECERAMELLKGLQKAPVNRFQGLTIQEKEELKTMTTSHPKQLLTGFHLKMIALAAMIVDHVGAVFPTPDVFRAIGRLAFPIYAFLIAEGCRHTRNRQRYLIRLGLFALISEAPFDLAFDVILGDAVFPQVDFLRHTNIFYTLFFAVAVIHIYEVLDRQPRRVQLAGAALGLLGLFLEGLMVALTGNALLCLSLAYAWVLGTLYLCGRLPESVPQSDGKALSSILAAVPTLLIFLLAGLSKCDYDWFGVLLIVALYLAGTPRRAAGLLVLVMALYYGLLYPLRYSFYPWYLVFALAAAVLAFFYSGERGRNLKWAFYWAYPVHIAVLGAFRLLLRL